MTRIKLNACLAALAALTLLAALAPAPAGAWCVIRETGRHQCTDGNYQQNCCTGYPRRWTNGRMTYRISTSTSSALHGYIDQGMAVWNNVAMANFYFTKGAATSAWDWLSDGNNIINIDSNFCVHNPGYCGTGILGYSGCWTTGSGSTYRATECDIILNGVDWTWGNGSGGTYDTPGVITHEAGHDAGLTHPGSTCRSGGSCGCGAEFPAATMYYSFSGGQPTTKANLELDDVASLVHVYPRSAVRVRVQNNLAQPISGAYVDAPYTATPVSGYSIAQGGLVLGHIAGSLVGNKVSSSTYLNGTPFSRSDANGYTNYIYPTSQLFAVRAFYGGKMASREVTPVAGAQTITLTLNTAASAGCTIGQGLDNTNFGYVRGGHANFICGTNVFYAGGDAVRSGDISDNQYSYLKTSAYGPKTISFYWRVSSESGYDYLAVYLDGVEKGRISGRTYWAKKTITIPYAGLHSIQWRYVKDGSVSEGYDCGWVDYLTSP